MYSQRMKFWFKLKTRSGCEAAIRVGALVALASILCKLVALLVYTFQVAAPESNVLLLSVVDLLLLSVLAILVLRRSRLAASMLLLYLASTWVALWVLGAPDGWLLQATSALVLITYLLLNSLAMLATFRWHNRYSADESVGGIA